MGRSKRSETGLMLVEDPESTLKTLCTFANNDVEWSSFKKAYETQVGRTENPVDKGTGDTHFYTLTIYNLLEPVDVDRTKYRLSLAGRKLCKLMADPKQRKKYENTLANLLRTNEAKGTIFKEFLKFVEIKRTLTEINKEFRPIPARTLIAWCKEADLIATYEEPPKTFVWALRKPKERRSHNKFWATLVRNYKELRKSEIFGVQRIYVPIGELRFNTRVDLGLEKVEFNDELEHLLRSNLRTKISLYGAPTDAFETLETFEYAKKLYVYISLRV